MPPALGQPDGFRDRVRQLARTVQPDARKALDLQLVVAAPPLDSSATNLRQVNRDATAEWAEARKPPGLGQP